MAKSKTPAPHGLGFNGHARSCDCDPCARNRVAERETLWREHGAAASPDPKKTVFVRSFWRAQKNHFNKMPLTRRLLVERLRALKQLTGR